MASRKKIKVAAIGIISCVGLSIISLLILSFYMISYIATTPGAIILFFIFIWLLLRLAIKILVFPGSCWFWKRSIEASFCVEISNQIYYKVRDLRLYLQAIQNQEKFSYQTNTPGLIESLLDKMKSIKNYTKLSKFQEILYKRLEDIKKSMLETVVIINSADSHNLWDWVQIKLEAPEPNVIVYEDYPDCQQSKKLIKQCADLEESLYKSCGAAKLPQQIKRWLFDDTLGNIHYLREDLLKRFNCEQIWIEGDAGKIDW
jgi:hypothetical protein